MKILIIGGAGYIGSHVAKYLAKEYSLVIFDNLSSGRRENLLPDAEFIHGDIMDYPSLLSAMRNGVEGIIHLAASKAAGESMVIPEKYSRNNIQGTLNILNAASETGIKNIVFSSSAAVYGEPEYLPIDEKHPTQPENYYGFTKLKIEEFLSWYERIKGIRYAALRYFNAAGYDPEGIIRGREINPANLLPVIMETAAGTREKLKIFGTDYPTPDGTGVRDYIHVTDLAEAHGFALKYLLDNHRSLTINLGSGEGLSVMDIVSAARKITGKEIPAETAARRPGDPAKLYATSEEARRLLGWQAKYSDVDTLVRTTWEIYKR